MMTEKNIFLKKKKEQNSALGPCRKDGTCSHGSVNSTS